MQSSCIGSSFKPPRNHPKLFSHHSVLDPKHKREADFTISDVEVKLSPPDHERHRLNREGEAEPMHRRRDSAAIPYSPHTWTHQ